MNHDGLFPTHRERMTRYYGFHSSIYDATRWMFLFGRTRLIESLAIRPTETVLDIGCGTGRNLAAIQIRLAGRGHLVAVDCSRPMLAKTEELVRRRNWSNVEVVDCEYGSVPVMQGQADAVIMSYSLSMIPNWQQALKCAKSELRPGGRIGVVDFCNPETGATRFGDWLRWNHVEIDRPYENVLTSMFDPASFKSKSAFAGLWHYFIYTGRVMSTVRESRNTQRL
jgi:S-adenosylmethionine-diacylgycerolhomoserine-N-methlytransferase